MTTSPYTLTPHEVATISQVEQAFGTTRLLPAVAQIPEPFLNRTKGSVAYHRIVEAVFYGTPLPDGNIEFREGFDADGVRNCVRAHLASFEPENEHKMAGVAYMSSLMFRLELPASAN